MSDGTRRECPIIPNEVVPVQSEEGILNYGGWIDTVHMFPDSRLNHAKYWDESGCISFQFLEPEILAALVERGIPLVMRSSIYERELNAHKDHCWNTAVILGQIASDGTPSYESIPPPVPRELMFGGDVDSQVKDAAEHLDAEIDYYLHHEWGE